MARKSKKLIAGPAPEPELIAISKASAGLRAAGLQLYSLSGASTSKLEKALKKYNCAAVPLFGPTEERVEASVAAQAEFAMAPLASLAEFYRLKAPDADLEGLQKELLENDLFEAVYLKPPVGLPEEAVTEEVNTMVAAPEVPPPATPDFAARQLYLDPAPGGVDARWAWTQTGGRGAGVHITDIEGAWRFSHEDLVERQGGVVGGTEYGDVSWRNHGTAVLGEYGGDVNTFGITGISPDAVCTAVSHGTLGSAGAINHAAARLSAGDILLLEMHRPGPRHNYQPRGDQRGYIAVEWWPDDFAAILNAARRGIIIVEAAGNGAEDLDDVLYETPGLGFPPGWSNPFRRSNRDSGAIVVGAGAPPPGTHGRNHGPDRSRLGFSNFGSVIDTQGWGREVTTCGYGDLQGGTDEDLWYTDHFSGTSSASPIVTGVLACLQGMARARNQPVFTPAQLRDALRTTGSPQQDAPGRPATQRIGSRPDLPALAGALFGGSGGNRRSVAFRREVEQWRPLEVRAFIDISPELVAAHSTSVLQQALVSAQPVTAGADGILSKMALMFRVSDLAGQAIEIAGPAGGGRYRYWGSIAADGLGQLYVDEGHSSTGSDKYDLVAEIQGVDTRFAFDGTLQRYVAV